MPRDEFICPNCGAEVPANAKACPECGSDEKTGWSDDTIYDGTDIEDPEEFDYDDWKRREVEGRGPRRTGKRWFWWIVTLLILAVVLSLIVARLWCAIP
ncbi:MAG: zinc-ribbon domain-containing protein [Verrucomicrobiia bacterium]|jgi:RNA polymerase subunit RPABC4/transcription elongation factor Spt4